MTEHDIKQLLRLLKKFRSTPAKDPQKDALSSEFNNREAHVLSLIEQWVRWYGRDELDMDI